MSDVKKHPATTKIPEKPGFYWFFGEVSRGSMGCHYNEPLAPFEPELVLIEIFKITNGVLAKGDGRFIHLEPFDKEKHREGPIGYWWPAELPPVPEDSANLFTHP